MAALALAATALLWSSGGLAIKLVGWHPMAITGLRSALAVATLAMVLHRRLGWAKGPARSCLGRFSRLQWAAAASYAGLLVTNVLATKLTTSANAILLAYTAPVYVALLAPRFLGERTRAADWGFVAVILAGMVLFFLDGLSPAGLWGNVIAMGTGLCYALFTLCMRAQREAPAMAAVEAVLLGHLLTALCGLPFCFGTLPDAAGWAGLVYLGVVQQGLSLLLYTWAVTRLGALETILLMTLEPICNPLWVALGHGERPGPWALAGGAVVLAAVTARGIRGALGRAS
ncbi:DMT family transporter [Megalodesulfovibrio paquesii]